LPIVISLNMTVNVLSAKEDDIARAFELSPDIIEELASLSEFFRVDSRKGTRKFVMVF